MEIDGCYFSYNGFESDDDNLSTKMIIAHTETSYLETMVAEKEYSKLKVNGSPRWIIQRSKYEQPLEFDTEFICESGVLSEAEARTISNKIFNSSTYHELRFKSPCESEEQEEEPTYSSYYLNCILSPTSKIMGSIDGIFGIAGFVVHIQCDAPFAHIDWRYPAVNDISISQDSQSAVISYANSNLKDDYEKYFYPVLHIETPDSLQNSTTKTKVWIKNDITNSNNQHIELRETVVTILGHAHIKLDNKNVSVTRVYGNSVNTDSFLFSEFNGKFLRLVGSYGYKNTLSYGITTDSTHTGTQATFYLEGQESRWLI